MEVNTSSGKRAFTELPHKCPYCHKSITPNIIYGYLSKKNLEVFMHCPDPSCGKSFIGYYSVGNTNVSMYLQLTSQGTIINKPFSKEINTVSEAFVTIYDQAFAAEQQNLLEICGVGYRKALEFLIKDYSILKHPDKKEDIEKKLLGKVIDNYVTDERIKKVAKRAAWLGNDETHYVRKWETKDLQDLKKLIDLTVHWIEMEALTASFEEEMPE